METRENNFTSTCPRPELSALIDGELSPSEELELEAHLVGCRVCTSELNSQKHLLNALDHSLEAEDLTLPADFAKVVVAAAESDVSGLRRPSEWRRAALICTGLFLLALVAMGSNADRSFAAASSVADKTFAIVASVGHVFYDIGLGFVFIFKSLASAFVFGSSWGTAGLLFLFVTSLFLSSRLLLRFYRR